ncbi:hypothetical protein EKO04_009163 [Ascochyta lentis]|uniref:Uncharacterized protein n=1 Tax=Ascochyta lentis TaxID=205686 RepID=A0A8H7MC30_9PLEO|nr:hypothetical protein EKO04_009163 [Ascochyta lentis]
MAPKKIPNSLQKSNIENAELRSGYGDMHAHRNAASMAAHVADLRSRGIIDEKMAVELLKPSTNREQPEMTSVVTAERHRLKRDKEMEKFVEDYQAGRIDEWGNAVAPQPTAGAQGPVLQEQDTDSETVTIDRNENDGGRNESDDESSNLTDTSNVQTQPEPLAASAPKKSSPEASTPLPKVR